MLGVRWLQKPSPKFRGCWLYAADGLEARARVDFSLGEDRCLRSETLDDAANERPDIRGCDQDWRFALAGGFFEPLAHQGDEF